MVALQQRLPMVPDPPDARSRCMRKDLENGAYGNARISGEPTWRRIRSQQPAPAGTQAFGCLYARFIKIARIVHCVEPRLKTIGAVQRRESSQLRRRRIRLDPAGRNKQNRLHGMEGNLVGLAGRTKSPHTNPANLSRNSGHNPRAVLLLRKRRTGSHQC